MSSTRQKIYRVSLRLFPSHPPRKHLLSIRADATTEENETGLLPVQERSLGMATLDGQAGS